MRYSLADLIRLANPNSRKRQYAVPGVELPLYVEQELLALQVKVLRAWETAYRQLVLPHYDPPKPGQVRDTVPGMEAGMEQADAEVQRLLLILGPQFSDWVVRAERLHTSQFARGVKTATGVDLTTAVGLPPANETMATTLARLINLVTGLSDDTRKTLSDIVWRGFTNRTPRSKVAREIRDALQIKRNRAMLIARDQTTKLAAVLDEERQLEAGIYRYRWRKSGKARPRPHHVAREGLLFWWKKPPYDGHPGYAINCGCKAEAYIDLDD